MVDFSNGPLVTPERVVVLSVFCVGIPAVVKILYQSRGVAVGVRNECGGCLQEKEARHSAEQGLCGEGEIGDSCILLR